MKLAIDLGILFLAVLLLIIGGPVLTGYYFKKNDPVNYYAGNQPEPNGLIIPKWVSLIVLSGWGLFILGIILLIINR